MEVNADGSPTKSPLPKTPTGLPSLSRLVQLGKSPSPMPGRVPGTTPKSRVVASNSALTVLAGDGKMVEIFTPDEPSTPAAKTSSGLVTD